MKATHRRRRALSIPAHRMIRVSTGAYRLDPSPSVANPPGDGAPKRPYLSVVSDTHASPGPSMRKGAIILWLPILLLTGCGGSSGFLTGDTQPTAWIKHYCFDGQGSVRAGVQPWASGETMGAMESRALVVYGDIAPDARLEMARKGCRDVDDDTPQ